MNNFREIFEFLNKYGGNRLVKNPNNANYNEEEYNMLRGLQRKAYDDGWKSIVQYVIGNLKINKIEVTQQWQNSGNIFDYFWTQFKGELRMESASSISVFARKSGLQVKLTWHFSYGKKSNNSLKQHNMWTSKLDEWINNNRIDTSKYTIWYEGDGNNGKEIALVDYIKNQDEQDFIANSIINDKNFLVEIGKLFDKGYVEADEETILDKVVSMID